MNFDNIEGLSEEDIISLFEAEILEGPNESNLIGNCSCIRASWNGQYCSAYFCAKDCYQQYVQLVVNERWRGAGACYYANDSSACPDYNYSGCRR